MFKQLNNKTSVTYKPIFYGLATNNFNFIFEFLKVTKKLTVVY